LIRAIASPTENFPHCSSKLPQRRTANLHVVNLHVNPTTKSVTNQDKFFRALGIRVGDLRKKHGYTPRGMISCGFSARTGSRSSRSSDYRHDAAAHLRGVRGSLGEACARLDAGAMRLAMLSPFSRRDNGSGAVDP